MSRTDHHEPDWVRALHTNNRTASHHWGCDSNPTSRQWQQNDGSHACDIDDPSRYRWNTGCGYFPNDRPGHHCRPVNNAALHNLYYGPERAAVRDSLRNAARDYNANGDTDIEAPTRQARSSDWHGGWWD